MHGKDLKALKIHPGTTELKKLTVITSVKLRFTSETSTAENEKSEDDTFERNDRKIAGTDQSGEVKVKVKAESSWPLSLICRDIRLLKAMHCVDLQTDCSNAARQQIDAGHASPHWLRTCTGHRVASPAVLGLLEQQVVDASMLGIFALCRTSRRQTRQEPIAGSVLLSCAHLILNRW